MWVSSSPSSADIAALELNFPEVIHVPSAALAEETSGWETHAILARSLHRWIAPDSIIREFRRLGVAGEVSAVTLAHRCYIFRFAEPSEKELVLGRPLVVNGQPISTAQWSSQFIPAPDSLSTALLWVRLPNLPIEFWNDDVLSSILAPAGQFLFSDSSTKDKQRGGFARACVRINLDQPLRPGVRARGCHSPFWQQFAYEHLDGICTRCGSLHFTGDCPFLVEAEPSSAAPLYGPWMAALRQRCPPSGQFNGPRRKTPGASSPPGFASRAAAADGWQTPTKFARRRLSKNINVPGSSASVSSPTSDGLNGAVSADGGAPDAPPASLNAGSKAFPSVLGSPVPQPAPVSELNRRKTGRNAGVEPPSIVSVPHGAMRAGTVNISAPGSQTEGLSSKNCLNLEAKSVNPFALLGTDKWAGRPTVQKDVNPGPTKRAKPVEGSTPRASLKTEKRKGKAKAVGSVTSMGNFNFSAQREPSSGVLAPNPPEGYDHDATVSCRKAAILRQEIDVPTPKDTVAVMDDTHTVESVSQNIEDGSLTNGMVEGQTGSQSFLTI